MINSSSYWDLYDSSGNTTLTIGDSDTQGTIDVGTAGRFRLRGSNSNQCRVYGGDQLKPAIVTGGDFDWDASATKVHLKWIDYQQTMTTGGGASTITLDGDCEFDAVTISQGDTLDINGQHAIFGDNLLILGTDGSLGTLDFGDGAIVKCSADFKCDDADANIYFGTGSVVWMV